jgi:cobalt-zinc-cadmium resistance protein CzcA
VLSSYLLKGGAEHDTWLIAWIKAPYLKMLHWALGNSARRWWAASAAGGHAGPVPLLGTAFIPEMKEGSVVPGINRCRTSRWTSRSRWKWRP